MKKWTLVFDVERCTGCNNCTLAVQDEYVGNDFPGYAAAMPRHGHRWIDIERHERGSVPMVDVAYLAKLCQHCDDAPCAKAAKNGAVKKREDGIVVIDPVLARGQKQIVESCPYGAIFWNDEKQLPQHWNFDAHLIDAGWKEPRCAQSCPTGALTAHKLEDGELRAMRAAQGLEEWRPELKTAPRVLYRNLKRFTAGFVGGSVATKTNGVEDCVGGAEVRLFKGAQELARATTDPFGDFKFDGLPLDGAAYRVEVAGKTLGAVLTDSVYLGVIYV